MTPDEHLASHDAQLALLTSLLARQQEMPQRLLTRMVDMPARMTHTDTRMAQHDTMLQRLIDLQRHRNGG